MVETRIYCSTKEKYNGVLWLKQELLHYKRKIQWRLLVETRIYCNTKERYNGVLWLKEEFIAVQKKATMASFGWNNNFYLLQYKNKINKQKTKQNKTTTKTNPSLDGDDSTVPLKRDLYHFCLLMSFCQCNSTNIHLLASSLSTVNEQQQQQQRCTAP